MIDTPMGPLVRWVVDVHVLGSLLLVLWAGSMFRVRQPARRLAAARATSGGLIVLVVLSAAPGWPRLSWREAPSWVPQNRPSVASARPEPVGPRPDVAALSRGSGAILPASEPHDPVRSAEGQVTASETPVPVRLRGPSLVEGLIGLYLAGATMAVAWLGLGALQAGRLLKGGRPAPDTLGQFLGGPIPRLRLSAGISQPMAVGLMRPAIVLPADFASRQSEDALAAALRHEEAHVRNGDLVHLAVLRLLLPVLYLHPIYWWLRRQVRLDQEWLADAAASGTDRIAYAEALLGWAKSNARAPRGRLAGALALAERPSELHRRIAALLDPAWQVEARCPRVWRMVSGGLLLLAALGLSFGTLRPAAVAMDVPKTEGRTGGVPADAIVFRGRVVDPDGRPFAGASMYISFYRWAGHGRPQSVRVVSDRDGRFRFAVERDEFDRPELQIWRGVRVIALADGYAPGGSDSLDPDCDREVTVRLARDDEPITGRLVDLEGRPVAGATVRVVSIDGPPGGDLTPWLAARADSRSRESDEHYRHLRRIRLTAYDGLPEISAAATGPDGVLTIRGIGRERMAVLKVEGPTIRTMEVSVMTRAGEPVRASVFGSRKNDMVKIYHAARFELTAPPSRPVEGFVRDRDTGAPIAGAAIRSYRLADQDLGNYQIVGTRTDKDGRFRLTGLPLGKGNEVYIFPPEGEPYLPSLRKLDELTADGPLRAELVLKRGVWMSGKVTDKVTGKPTWARIRYAAAKDNPHLAEAIGFSEVWENGEYTSAGETAEAGTYRIAILPGRGILLAEGHGAIYPDLEQLGGARPHLTDYLPTLYGGQAFAEIDVKPDRSAPRGDFALDPGRTVEAIVLDPEGKPLAGAMVNGRWTFQGWNGPEASERFTIHGLLPPKPRTLGGLLKARGLEDMAGMVLPQRRRFVIVEHEARKLAGWAAVTADTAAPIEIRLQPWGVVTGRMVDSGGEPRAHFSFRPQVLDKLRPERGSVDHWPFRVTTDRVGRFRVEGLVPGLRYRLSLETAEGAVNLLRGPEVAPLKAGENRDLGDVVAIVPGESE